MGLSHGTGRSRIRARPASQIPHRRSGGLRIPIPHQVGIGALASEPLALLPNVGAHAAYHPAVPMDAGHEPHSGQPVFSVTSLYRLRWTANQHQLPWGCWVLAERLSVNVDLAPPLSVTAWRSGFWSKWKTDGVALVRCNPSDVCLG